MAINVTSAPALNTETVHGIKTAKLVKNQTELEGKMALDLIKSADISTDIAVPVGNKGQIVNIKA